MYQSQGLSVSMTPLQHKIKQSNDREITLPVMITLNCAAQQDRKKPLDLICIIDVSGSMYGEKLPLVQKSLHHILDILEQGDRLALIKFNSDAEVIFPLDYVNEESKPQMKKSINTLRASGHTDIDKALRLGFDMVQKNPKQDSLKSIYFLSDGDESESTKVEDVIKQYPADMNFTMTTFGYGQDHEARTMDRIAKVRGGDYYPVTDIAKIEEVLTLALRGLQSILFQNVKVKLNKLNNQGVDISNFYGSTTDSLGNHELSINYVQEGSRDYIFDIRIPRGQEKKFLQQQYDLFSTQVSSTESQNLSKSTMSVEFYEGKVDVPINTNVIKKYAAQLLSEACLKSVNEATDAKQAKILAVKQIDTVETKLEELLVQLDQEDKKEIIVEEIAPQIEQKKLLVESGENVIAQLIQVERQQRGQVNPDDPSTWNQKQKQDKDLNKKILEKEIQMRREDEKFKEQVRQAKQQEQILKQKEDQKKREQEEAKRKREELERKKQQEKEEKERIEREKKEQEMELERKKQEEIANKQKEHEWLMNQKLGAKQLVENPRQMIRKCFVKGFAVKSEEGHMVLTQLLEYEGNLATIKESLRQANFGQNLFPEYSIHSKKLYTNQSSLTPKYFALVCLDTFLQDISHNLLNDFVSILPSPQELHSLNYMEKAKLECKVFNQLVNSNQKISQNFCKSNQLKKKTIIFLEQGILYFIFGMLVPFTAGFVILMILIAG